MKDDILHAQIPMKWVGPMKLLTEQGDEEVMVPLATYETPLWPSVRRGAMVSAKCGGIHAVVVNEQMTRSVEVQAKTALEAVQAAVALTSMEDDLQNVVSTTSRFAVLKDVQTQVVGNLLWIRFSFKTGDAAGHNMVTAAADALLEYILSKFPSLQYVSISGNYCTDKKPSAVNGILGRGKYVIAEGVIARSVCQRILKTTPEKIADLCVKKNWMGSTVAGGLRSANAHFANMLLAVYLAAGQDAANIVEGSQGFTFAEVRGDELCFSVTVPHIIVGTVGNGKDVPHVQECLAKLGCKEGREPGDNARRLACITAGAVWCGELSLLAAQTNPGELMKAHLKMERSA